VCLRIDTSGQLQPRTEETKTKNMNDKPKNARPDLTHKPDRGCVAQTSRSGLVFCECWNWFMGSVRDQLSGKSNRNPNPIRVYLRPPVPIRSGFAGQNPVRPCGSLQTFTSRSQTNTRRYKPLQTITNQSAPFPGTHQYAPITNPYAPVRTDL
jgi:hypothetical protein